MRKPFIPRRGRDAMVRLMFMMIVFISISEGCVSPPPFGVGGYFKFFSKLVMVTWSSMMPRRSAMFTRSCFIVSR